MDVTASDFEEKVLLESRQRPVVVDFWAPWCGPCRVLAPTLESLEKEYAGKFMLAKVNTDVEQALARAYQIMSIPDVKIFKDGKVAGGFVGAQSADRIREILDQFIVPEEYNTVMELALSSPQKALDFLALLKGRRREEAAWMVARGFLQQLPPNNTGAAECLKYIPEFGSAFSEARTAALKMIELGKVNELATLMGTEEGKIIPLLDSWLEQIENSKNKQQDKEIMIRAFHILGNEHPLTQEYRRALSRVLF